MRESGLRASTELIGGDMDMEDLKGEGSIIMLIKHELTRRVERGADLLGVGPARATLPAHGGLDGGAVDGPLARERGLAGVHLEGASRASVDGKGLHCNSKR
jgi:hypothetical protein